MSVFSSLFINRSVDLCAHRYQWWKDGISDTFKGNPPKHPVLLALRSVMDLQGQGVGEFFEYCSY